MSAQEPEAQVYPSLEVAEHELLQSLLQPRPLEQPEPVGQPIGAGGAGRPPANAPGVEDPGQIPMWGPKRFEPNVQFFADRFAAVEIMMARLLDKIEQQVSIEGWRFENSAQSPSSGPLTIPVFDVPPMMKYTIHRIYIEAVGFSWASPYQAAGAMVELQVDGEDWDGHGLVGSGQPVGQLPIVFTAGSLSGLEPQDGERFQVVITVPPASTNIKVRVQGVMVPMLGLSDYMRMSKGGDLADWLQAWEVSAQ